MTRSSAAAAVPTAAGAKAKSTFASVTAGETIGQSDSIEDDLDLLADHHSCDSLTENFGDVYYLHHFDQPSLVLVAHPLIGTSNYTSWREAVLMALLAKNKVVFVDGSVPKPPISDPLSAAWVRCNITVCSWLLNSVSQDIADSLRYIRSVVQIWRELKDQFHQSNRPRVFQLCKSLNELHQGSMSVTTYFTQLKILWNELKQFRSDPLCTCEGLQMLLASQQEDCIIQFLIGLNESFSNIQSQILMMEPFPTLSKVFALVAQEERQRSIRIDHFPETSVSETVMAVTAPNSSTDSSINASFVQSASTGKQDRRDRYFCTHCKIKGHSRERCFKLIGYPSSRSKGKSFSGHGSSDAAQVNQTSAMESTLPQSLNATQVQQLLSLLSLHSQLGASVTQDPHHLASVSSFSGPCTGQADWDS